MANQEVWLNGANSKSTSGQALEFCWDLDAKNAIQAQWCFDAAAAKAHYEDIAYGYSPVVAWKNPGNYTVTLIVREATAKKNVPFNFYNVTTFNILIAEHITYNVDAGKDRIITNGAKTSLMGAVHVKEMYKYNDERVVECGWDFTNDGIIDYKQSFDPTENQKNANCPAMHTYNVNGTVKNDTIFNTRLQAEVDGVLHLIPASDNEEVKVDFKTFYNDTINLTVPAPPDIPPIVTCGPDKTGDTAAFVGEETKFDAVASDPDDDRIVNYEWDFNGDGTIDASNPASGDASYTYTSPGSYIASVNVSDYRKASTICMLNVSVIKNDAPVAVINSPDQGKTGELIPFDASDSTDANGAYEIVSYSWDFDARDGLGSDTTGKTVSHTFTKGGTYTVTLTVKDKHNAEGTATADIRIVQTYDVKVEATGPMSAEVTPGSSQIFTLKITNTGNGDDCFDLDKSGTKTTWGDLSVNSVCMKADESKNVNLRVSVPAATTAGDVATITVGATSQGSTEAKDNVQIRVTAKQSYGVGLHMDEATTTMKAGAAKTVSIRLTNLGNGKDTVKFSTDGPDKAWFDFKSDSVALDSGETKETTVTIMVPSNAKGGDHPVTITAFSVGDNTQKVSVIYTVTVKAKATHNAIPGFDPVVVLLALAVAFVAVGAWKKRKQQA
jgi:PKD repeat protein